MAHGLYAGNLSAGYRKAERAAAIAMTTLGSRRLSHLVKSVLLWAGIDFLLGITETQCVLRL
jgi:hypothetical protein